VQELSQHLSHTLKKLRKEKEWSLDRTAKETGVSKAMLGQIERGESSPTVATLWKIAGGFHCSLSTFIEPYNHHPSTLIRNADDLRHQPAKDKMLVAPIFPFDPQLSFEIFELTLLPHYERYSEPHETGVIEFVLVLEGEMGLFIDQQWQTLTKGMSARFAADKPHGYRNLSTAQAVFHNVIHYAR